jgi:hypothetical protein
MIKAGGLDALCLIVVLLACLVTRVTEDVSNDSNVGAGMNRDLVADESWNRWSDIGQPRRVATSCRTRR